MRSGILGAMLLLTVLLLTVAQRAAALDHITIQTESDQKQVTGKLLVTAADGGLLLQGTDGTLWSVPPEEIAAHTSDDLPFVPLTRAELADQLLKELPAGFEVHQTEHYLICHNSSKAYAQWCGGLFERLYRAFTNFWDRKGFELHEPEFPLVALVFGDRTSYAAHAREELGDAVNSVIGYYSLRSNRMTLYDLTGVDSLRRGGDRRGSAAQINQMLARPEAERTVATVIHEATHQIAFNCGLQTRYADIPLWVSEGIALYFETPDLGSSKGWRNIGGVNKVRLGHFRGYLRTRTQGSLESLLVDDQRIRDPKRANDAYGEAWAMTYFLIRQHPKEYLEYLQRLSQKDRLVWDTPEERLAEFKAVFGQDLPALDAEFLRHINKVR